MAPAIAIYASAAAAKPSEPTSATSTSTSKPATGGLSLLFSSSSSPSPPSISRHVDELSRSDEIGCSSYSYSSFPSSFKSRDHLSPISVFQPPSSSSSSSRSPPTLWAGQRYTRDRLFNSFVRNALGSCLDYVPLSPSYQEEGPVGVLGFDLEDGLNGTEPDCDPCAKEMLADAQSRHNIFHDELVVKAFFEAEKAHRGQMRASGDPYLQHCVETAILLADIGANSTVISAGLLHDTIDDSFLDYEHIFNMFRANVADLVEGVSKLSHLSKLARENDTASRTEEADRLHTMFLAMNDPRAVLIKLADRLHNMMTLDALTPQKQQRFAKETLEIFVPLAHRLGISSWKEKLENICFKFLYPEKYEEISSKLENSIDDDLIIDAVDELEKCLNDEGIAYCHLSGRNKSLYSIHSKMLKKKISMDEILDIHGLRLIVEKVEDCYKALEIVHKLWPRVNGRYKDYISHPKRNGYKSLHTVVQHTHHHPLEIQIRTRDMHFQAEYGYAAHWSYKEGSCKYSFIPHLIQWGRWVATWQCETLVQSSCATSLCKFPSHSDDCPYSYTPENKDGPVFVIMLANEKMCVHEFPANSTVRDLLERVGVGSSVCSPYSLPLKEDLRTWVNREPVNDQTRKLNMGDFVTLTSLSESREKIQRMYNGGIMSSSRSGSGSGSGSYWGN